MNINLDERNTRMDAYLRKILNDIDDKITMKIIWIVFQTI